MNRVSASTAPGYIQQLIDQVEADDTIKNVLATLSRYAINGRFFNLDALGDQPQLVASPAQLWEELHQVLLDERTDTLAGLASHVQEDWEDARHDLNNAIVESVRVWCRLVARAWMTGVIGAEARRWAPQLELT